MSTLPTSSDLTLQLLEESDFGFLLEADAESTINGNCDVGWPQTVCSGVCFEATEGVSMSDCFIFFSADL